MSLWFCLYEKIDPNDIRLGKDDEDGLREIFDVNITHNLTRMADVAKIYGVMWRPDENGIKTAADCIPAMAAGVVFMEANREMLEQYNPSNGWGSYEVLLQVATEILTACRENPDAIVGASR